MLLTPYSAVVKIKEKIRPLPLKAVMTSTATPVPSLLCSWRCWTHTELNARKAHFFFCKQRQNVWQVLHCAIENLSPCVQLTSNFGLLSTATGGEQTVYSYNIWSSDVVETKETINNFLLLHTPLPIPKSKREEEGNRIRKK